MPHGVLDPGEHKDEIARRIRAARELRGLSQDGLGKLVAADGLGIHDVGRIERGEVTMTRVHRDALIRHLRVPERWFTAENVDEIVGVQMSEEAIAQFLTRRLFAAGQAVHTEPGRSQPGEVVPGRPAGSVEAPAE